MSKTGFEKDPDTGEWLPEGTLRKRREEAARAKNLAARKLRAGLVLAVYFHVGLLVVVAIIALLAVISGLPYERLTVKEFDGTVTSQILCGREKTKYCAVVTRDDGQEEVFENTDSLWWWKWNSADYQAYTTWHPVPLHRLRLARTNPFNVPQYRFCGTPRLTTQSAKQKPSRRYCQRAF